MNVSVIGAGNWGTVFALYLHRIGHRVCLYEFFRERAERIKNERENKEFLPGHFIPEPIKITSDIEEAVNFGDFLVIAQPSHTISAITSHMKPYVGDDHLIVSLSKGIEPETLRRVSEIIEDNIPSQRDRVVALSGPSIAREVVKGVPTTLVASSKHINLARRVQYNFSSKLIRIYTSRDIVGVELGGSLKNVYAIAAGILDGLGLGMNAKAALLTRAIAEMKRLGMAMGGRPATFSGLSGTGDLIVTAFSEQSRNHHVGKELGKGRKLDDILSEMVEVAEGVNTTRSAVKLGEKYGVELPIAREVYQVLFNGKSPQSSIEDLMTRKLKEED